MKHLIQEKHHSQEKGYFFSLCWKYTQFCFGRSGLSYVNNKYKWLMDFILFVCRASPTTVAGAGAAADGCVP